MYRFYNFVYFQFKFLQNPIGGVVKQIVFAKEGHLDDEGLSNLPDDLSVYMNDNGWFDLNSIQVCMDEARGYVFPTNIVSILFNFNNSTVPKFENRHKFLMFSKIFEQERPERESYDLP